ncbi:hypothetical protein [Ferruginivarius sediminum]|uniref:hypothetical protein n=1 Tax=Ferruginivarius sediminum TaxID=2661937 RepID=UPI0011C03CAA|nr:hypothetical protein [Ferruginivarius sediminum]
MAKGDDEDVWKVHSLRLTVFTTSSTEGLTNLWEDLTGEEPETDEVRRREGVRRQTGTWGHATLTVAVSNRRIDITINPQLTQVPEYRLYTGPYKEEENNFLGLVRPWLESPQVAITRIAYAGTLLLEAKDRDAAYEKFGQYVQSVHIDRKNCKEITYRVNRPRQSQHAIELNRITNWSVIRAEMENGLTEDQKSEKPTWTFLNLEFDHNTAPEHKEVLKSADVVPIFNELVCLANENAQQGEV